jgi:hypothetical protein
MGALDDFRAMLAALPAQVVEAVSAADRLDAVAGDAIDDYGDYSFDDLWDDLKGLFTAEEEESREEAVVLPFGMVAEEVYPEAVPVYPEALLADLGEAMPPAIPEAAQAAAERAEAVPNYSGHVDAVPTIYPGESGGDATEPFAIGYAAQQRRERETKEGLLDRPEMPAVEDEVGLDAAMPFMERPEVVEAELDREAEATGGVLPGDVETEEEDEIDRAEELGGGTEMAGLLSRIAEAVEELVEQGKEKEQGKESGSPMPGGLPGSPPANQGWEGLGKYGRRSSSDSHSSRNRPLHAELPEE